MLSFILYCKQLAELNEGKLDAGTSHVAGVSVLEIHLLRSLYFVRYMAIVTLYELLEVYLLAMPFIDRTQNFTQVGKVLWLCKVLDANGGAGTD